MAGDEPYWMPNMSTCLHSYEIAMAEGPESNGICVWCGKEERFKNYVDLLEGSWSDQAEQAYRAFKSHQPEEEFEPDDRKIVPAY